MLRYLLAPGPIFVWIYCAESTVLILYFERNQMAPVVKESLSNEGLHRFVLKLALEKYWKLV